MRRSARAVSASAGRALRVVLPLLLLLPCAARAERRVALVVGANSGWSSDRPLRYAEDDARRVRDVLVEMGGFAPTDITLALEPTAPQLQAALERAEATLRTAGEPTLFVFFYSGHADAQALHLRGPSQGLQALADRLTRTGATLTVAVFDSCMSGAVLNAKGASHALPVRLRAEEPTTGVALLSSSDADELSQESRALAGSVFTHHWVSALRGAAYAYAYARTRADTSSTALPQRPGFRFDLKGRGDVVLTTLRVGAAGLDIAAGAPVRYVVVDAAERHLVAEAVADPAQKQRLQLAPGAYKVKRPAAGGIEVAQLTLEGAGVQEAAALRYQLEPREAGFVKGGSAFSEWAATGSLAAGDPDAALTLFNRILEESPQEQSARQGKARALLLRSLEHQQAGDTRAERADVELALAFDPGLPQDPTFDRFSQRVKLLRAQDEERSAIRRATEDELANNPRLRRSWGLGLQLMSTKGVLVLEGHWLAKSYLTVTLGVDLVGPGVDLSVKWVPLGFQWSPYLAGGVHYGLRLWRKSSSVSVNGMPTALSYDDIWGRMAHLDVGLQWISQGGFTVEFGGGPMIFHTDAGGVQGFGFVNLGVGWYF
jgi:tetratricopeptide (TPR) repeat protein